jgi:hypothetical protein
MKIKKQLIYSPLIIFILVLFFALILFFGVYHAFSLFLNEDEDLRRQQEILKQINKEKIDDLKEGQMIVSAVTGTIRKIEGNEFLVSSRTYGDDNKDIRIKLKEDPIIYKYELGSNTDPEGALLFKEIALKKEDLKLGNIITFEFVDEMPTLYDLDKQLFEVEKVLLN